MAAPNTWFSRLTQQQRWFSPAGLLSSGAWFWWRAQSGWEIGLPVSPPDYSLLSVHLRRDDQWISSPKVSTFTSAVSLASPFASVYSGSSSVALTDAGSHVRGNVAVLIFPAGTATGVTWPSAWAAAPGSETFSAAEECAVFLQYLGRMQVSLRRIVHV